MSTNNCSSCFVYYRVFVGWLGDRKLMNRTILQGCGGILAASLTLVSLLFKSYVLLAVYEGFYGASTGKLRLDEFIQIVLTMSHAWLVKKLVIGNPYFFPAISMHSRITNLSGEYLVSGNTNSCMFYFPPAIFVALHGSVIVDVFTIERVDLGVGMTMVSSGLAGFLVLPLAGYYSLIHW